MGEAFPNGIYNRLESGFIGFVFHPEFAQNGLFYTVHSERGPGNPKTPDFIPPGYGPKDVTYHNVITEWHAPNPAADTFAGTRRELFREAHVVANLTHPMGAVEFNPTAKPGDADYGLLYTSGSDHGFSNGGGPTDLPPCSNDNWCGKRWIGLGLMANSRCGLPDYMLFRGQGNLERIQNAPLMLIGFGQTRDGGLVIDIIDEQ